MADHPRMLKCSYADKYTVKSGRPPSCNSGIGCDACRAIYEAHIIARDRATRTSREVVARFMRDNGFATGHGDSIYDLLRELEWQVNELKRAAMATERHVTQ